MTSEDWKYIWLKLGKPVTITIDSEYIKFVPSPFLPEEKIVFVYRLNANRELVPTDWFKVDDDGNT